MNKQSVQDDANHEFEHDNVKVEEAISEDAHNEETVSSDTTDSTQQGTGSSQDEVSPLIASLQAELEESKQRLLRTQADYDNYRRRTLKEKEELGKYASGKLITELLPVVDNFERALSINSDSEEVASYSKGVEMILRQFEEVLKAEGLTSMETVGQPFNPEYHQAVMQVESDEYEEGMIVEELQKGYMLKDRVLRPAMVKVSG